MNESGSTAIPQGEIAFQDVTFSYSENEPALKKVSFTIPMGKNVAIVGPSGSGKTTVLRLLEQLYEPASGSITVGGEPIQTLRKEAWRSHLSYVTQDATLFSGSVRECLTYGTKEAVSEERLAEVTKLAGVYDYIMEHGGFDAQLSIWGSAMSGGQRQRLVIARELLRDADILLLDEPTSALDAGTAAAISDTIYRRFAGKTVITVTHELSFISGADEIVVLEDGEVVGTGTHEKLMETCPIYRDLVEEQSYQEVFGQ